MIDEAPDPVLRSWLFGPRESKRIGALERKLKVPDDFDRMGEATITRRFELVAMGR